MDSTVRISTIWQTRLEPSQAGRRAANPTNKNFSSSFSHLIEIAKPAEDQDDQQAHRHSGREDHEIQHLAASGSHSHSTNSTSAGERVKYAESRGAGARYYL